jgi:type IV fimbrial biogenesis protein FimT
MAFSEIPRSTQKHRYEGFTLLEVLTSLAIASILVTAAVPAMQDFIIRNRMSAEVNTFVASLYLARSESVKRLRNVRLCPVDPDGDCDPSSEDWEQGWKVYYTDPVTGSEIVLQQNPALPSRFRIIGNQSSFAYDPTGQLANAFMNGTYIFCDTGGIAQARNVVVSGEGRVRTQLNTTGCS